jgi:peptidylprolyl isomerase
MEFYPMRFGFPALILAAAAVAAGAQTAPKSAAAAKTVPAGVTLPPGVPRVRGVVKTAFSLRYEDIKLGTGAEAEPNKIYHVMYTGYLAADGHKFDSSDDHRQPLKDKDGKPVLGDDGKPKLGNPEPIAFPQGYGRVIPGFDEGFAGMKIGGKRRLFIPWQLAYGAKGRPGPDAAHPGIPPKADLIFDIELVEVTDVQMPQGHPAMGAMPGRPMPSNHPAVSPGTQTPAASPAAPAKPAEPAVTTAPAQPATPPTIPQQ